MNSSLIIEKFKTVATTFSNESIAGWKAGGGKVVGYTCSFVPEELLLAAGLMPFRIRATGSVNSGLADDYFEAANICSMVRHTFNVMLTGAYDFLDGAVIGGGCDANRHIYDNLKRSPVKLSFLETIFFPHGSDDVMAEFYSRELGVLKSKIEDHFGVEITNDKLLDAIKLCNETRELQRKIYALRMSDNPPVTGAEMVAIMVAGSSLPKNEYNANLRELLCELAKIEPGLQNTLTRLMIVGPGNDETSLCDIIENTGGIVVTDLTCFGRKMVIGSVDEDNPDPLRAIADYQVLVRPFCPKNLGAQPHITKTVLESVKDFRVDGVVGQNFLCCDMWGGSLFILNKELRVTGTPMLRIEREYQADAAGQLKTRIQAFIETITGGAI